MAGVMDADTLLDVLSGLAALKVMPIAGVAVDPEQAFSAQENQGHSGRLGPAVTTTSLRYQAAPTKPGWLEQINPDGKRTLESFQNGVFEPLQDTDSSSTG
ncbi:MAG: hypothetical protein NTW02_03835 [Cyanobium sp. LacPavin_0920_WC12_MAG_62_9]|nr:hypothetical protein [Cyanobium sp. LacPavin_0920_WC12_MAG_62_9]